MKKFLITSLFLLVGTAQAQSLKGIYLNNQGTEALKQNFSQAAQSDFLLALKEDPNNLVARLNLGVSFLFAEDVEKAIKEFQLITGRGDANQEISHIAHFNIGRAYQDLEKPELALLSYQEALVYDPKSLPTKTNIELLMQQMSGQGKGGSGDQKQNQKDQNQDQDGQGEQQTQNPKDQQNQAEENDKRDKKSSPQDLSKKDIEKILEELKNQEQKIRALEYGQGEKNEEGTGKTW